MIPLEPTFEHRLGFKPKASHYLRWLLSGQTQPGQQQAQLGQHQEQEWLQKEVERIENVAAIGRSDRFAEVARRGRGLSRVYLEGGGGTHSGGKCHFRVILGSFLRRVEGHPRRFSCRDQPSNREIHHRPSPVLLNIW